jgi:hypothetical protein
MNRLNASLLVNDHPSFVCWRVMAHNGAWWRVMQLPSLLVFAVSFRIVSIPFRFRFDAAPCGSLLAFLFRGYSLPICHLIALPCFALSPRVLWTPIFSAADPTAPSLSFP